MSVILANATGETDGSMHQMLLKVNSNLPIVLISRPSNFVFNEQLRGVKDYILVDVCEYGHDVEFDNTHFFGRNTQTEFANFFVGDEWGKLDDFVAAKPPKLYLKRELLQKDVDDNPYPIRPIEYASWFAPPKIVSKEEFDARKIQVFFNWGYSSEYRRQLHGKIWTDAHKHGYMVCDNLYYLNQFIEHESNPKKWVSVHVPWFARHPMQDVLNVQGLSKISISHWGAGKKCFRSAEAPLNAVMAMPFDDYAWTFPWESMVNCIRFNKDNDPIGKIASLLNENYLHGIYANGVETVRKYYLPVYILHLESLMNEL